MDAFVLENESKNDTEGARSLDLVSVTVDDTVKIHSLQAASEHNAMYGRLTAFNEGKGRCKVKLETSGNYCLSGLKIWASP